MNWTGVVNLCFGHSVLDYELLNLQIPTINIVGALVKSGIRVLVYRYFERLRLSFFPLRSLFQTLYFRTNHEVQWSRDKRIWETESCARS